MENKESSQGLSNERSKPKFESVVRTSYESMETVIILVDTISQ